MESLYIVWPVIAVIGYFIGNVKGNGASGLLLGLLFGPVGWLVVLCFSDSRCKCRMCHGALDHPRVLRCKHCGCELPVQTSRGEPGRHSQRARELPKKLDPFEAWEQQEEAVEHAKAVGLPPIKKETGGQ